MKNLGRIGTLILTTAVLSIGPSLDIPSQGDSSGEVERQMKLKTYNDAIAECEDRGGYLPTIQMYLSMLQQNVISISENNTKEWLLDENGNIVLIDPQSIVLEEDRALYNLLEFDEATLATFRCNGSIEDHSEAF